MDLNSFKSKRKYLRASITKTCTKINDGIGSMDFPTLELHKAKLFQYQTDMKAANDKIFSGLIEAGVEDADLQVEHDDTERYSEKLILAINLVVNKMYSLQAPPASLPTVHMRPTRVKLPDIPMPTFGNKEGENLHDFFENLETILGDCPDLTPFQKLSFLKGQLSGEPLSLVSGLNVKRQRYEVAKELLIKAFASNVAQQYDTIRRLSELKFNFNCRTNMSVNSIRLKKPSALSKLT